jgi:hypothetical protein
MLPFTAAMNRIRIASDHTIMAFIKDLVGVHDRLQSRELEDERGRQQILHLPRLTSYRSFLISSRDHGSAFAFGSLRRPAVSRPAFRISPYFLSTLIAIHAPFVCPLPKPVHGASFSRRSTLISPTTCVQLSHVSTVGTDHAYESSCLRLSGLRPDRRSKIKCRHEGSAPCHACNIASREDCLLSAPVVKGRSYPVGYEGPSVRLRDSTDAHTFPPTKRPRVSSFHISHRANYVQPLLDPTVGCPDLPTPTLMLQACELLQAHFPEFGFLHRPSFVDQLLEGSVETARLHAILSVTARFMPGLVSQHGGPEAAGEFYAVKAETSVMLRVLDSPDPATVQSLLLISLHHWGACNGTRAWMLAGTSHLSRGMVLSLTMIQASGSGWRKR